MSLWSRIANTFRGRRLDRDLDEELQTHFEEARAVGRDSAEAALAFGSRLRAHEAMRDAVVVSWLQSLAADAVFGWRQLRKRKSASAAAILSLALGIGSCTAAFRLIDALFLRPLPVSDPGSLYVLGYGTTDGPNGATTGYSFDYPGFRLLRAAVKSQAELLAISSPARIGITYGSDPDMERVYRQYVSGWMFGAFGIKPAAGRLFTESDDVKPGGPPYAVLSYDYWARRFGKDPHAVGQKFRSGNDIFEIIGVAPEGFTGTEPGTLTDLFVATMMNAQAIGQQNWNWFRIWVRLNPTSDPEQVRQKLGAALLAVRREKVKSWPAVAKQQIGPYISAPVVLESASAGVSEMQHAYRRALLILAVLVALVLLIACANVANLMMVQAASRAREMALRVSIGAGRGRLIQLVIVESATVALIASILGFLFAWWAAPFVVGMTNSPDNPARLVLALDSRLAAFAAGLSFWVAILFGLAPALRASAIKPANALKGGDDPHARRRLMHALIGAQVAFCILVHFVAGLFTSSFQRLANQPIGFSAARVITLESIAKSIQPPQYWYQAVDHLRSVAGVESAAVASWALMSGTGWNQYVWANGHSPEEESNNAPWFLAVSPGWLQTMKIPLLGGRDFRPDDLFPKVAIVNETFARRFFDGRSPVGQTLEVHDDNARGQQRLRLQIVGLAGDARYENMRRPIDATVYVPFVSQSRRVGLIANSNDWGTFIVRTKNPDPLSMAALLRQEVPRGRPEFRVANIRTQEEMLQSKTLRERLLAMLSLFFGAVALALAGVGLYGVLDYAVVQRRRELGIRIALGAHATEIAWRVILEVALMLLLGAAAGLGLGMASERYFGTLLFHVKATDPGVLAAPALIIFAAALLAAVPPVLRALRIDPATLLRTE